MGWGDYLMTTGQVRIMKEENPNIQIIIKKKYEQTQYYKNIFFKNPYITHSNLINLKKKFIEIERVKVGKIDEKNNKIIWNENKVSEIGNFYPTQQENKFADQIIKSIKENWRNKNSKKEKGILYISDEAKKNQNVGGKIIHYEHFTNKEWGLEKWKEFIKITSKDWIIVKTSKKISNSVDGSYAINCNFRQIYAIMKLCDFFIGGEGGQSHLWAVTKKKGIVFFGHWIPPYLTGYPMHTNLSTNKKNHCGSLKVCDECKKFFFKLNPEYVQNLIMEQI